MFIIRNTTFSLYGLRMKYEKRSGNVILYTLQPDYIIALIDLVTSSVAVKHNDK